MPGIGQIKEYVESQEDFECYIERVEQFFEANDIDEKKRVAVLLTVYRSSNIWAVEEFRGA